MLAVAQYPRCSEKPAIAAKARTVEAHPGQVRRDLCASYLQQALHQVVAMASGTFELIPVEDSRSERCARERIRHLVAIGLIRMCELASASGTNGVGERASEVAEEW